MARILVTGIAGFIGSHLAEKLLELGYEVVGIDCLTDYYSPDLKERNIQSIQHSNITIIRENLLNVDLKKMLQNIDYVFHLAAQAGVRDSWGKSFEIYANNNVLATQELLEACKNEEIKKIVYASSSSIYGDAKSLPMNEDDKPNPISPYGVTKLAAERLCNLYWKNFGVPVISVRYFTVYGPRQRPDMAFHKFIKAILNDREITIYGDGNQTRDFTYVADTVDGTIKAMESDAIGEVFNIGGGSTISVNEVIEILEKNLGIRAKVRYVKNQKGDVKHTYADISKARKILGYKPKIKIGEGLKKEIEWMNDLYCNLDRELLLDI